MKSFLVAVMLMACSGAAAQSLQTVTDHPLNDEYLRGPVKEVEILELYGFEGEELVSEDTVYLHFDEAGQLIQRNSIWEEEYPYSEYRYVDGKLAEVTAWSDVGSVSTKYHYSNGCLAFSVTTFFVEGKPDGSDTIIYQCDSLCHITMEIFHDGNDTIRCTYDENGRMKTWCNWERCAEGCDGCTSYIYDDQGRLVKEQHRHRYSNGYKEYIYNEEGYVSDYIDFFVTKEHTHYEYTYDNHGNWLTRKSFNNGMYNLTIRKITYYER